MELKRKKFNISLLGDTMVGKSSLCLYETGEKFDRNMILTVGVDTFLCKKKFEQNELKFKLFDNPGRELFRSLLINWNILSDGYLLIFSIDNRNSFENINLYISLINNNTDIKKKVLFLVGNRIDLERKVSKAEAEEFAKKNNLKYFETSCKTGFGVHEVFNNIFNDIYELNKKYIAPNNLKKDFENNWNNKKENNSIQLTKEKIFSNL